MWNSVSLLCASSSVGCLLTIDERRLSSHSERFIAANENAGELDTSPSTAAPRVGDTVVSGMCVLWMCVSCVCTGPLMSM